MRIVVLGPSYPFRGGIAHYTTSLFRAIARRHTARYLGFIRQYPRWLFPGRDEREPPDSPFREPRVERVLDSLRPGTWFETGRRARRWRADLIVMPWWVPFWAAPFRAVCASAGERVRKVFLCHNVRPHERGALDALATRWTLAAADALIAHSSAEVAALRAWFPRTPVRRCFHPVYDAFASDGPAAPASGGQHPAIGDRSSGARIAHRKSQARCGSPNREGASLLFFGFVRPYKRLDVLVRALAPVRERRPDVRLRVVGEFWGDTRAEIERLVADLGLGAAVEIVDRYVESDEVARTVRASDLMVLPYDSVTGSGALQVAYALDTPVIATRVGGFCEVVRDGVDGLLVPPGDPRALAEAILRALAPETLARLREGARTAKDRFAWERMVETIEDLAAALGIGR